MHPIVFEPIIHRAIWGGNNLGRQLGKPTSHLTDAAESWDVCDLPGNESVVACGPFSGHSIRSLMSTHRQEILGRHAHRERFPLLIKFLDARHQLSVQVHPKDPTLQVDGSIRPGKAEAWVVIAKSDDSCMALGLHEGVTEEQLRTAVQNGDATKYLHTYSPQVGDCIFLEPGTVHALGGGILVAEVQEPSDITYRLYDWARVDAQGRSRELHIEQGLRSTRFDLGPVLPTKPRPLANSPSSECLVDSSHFIIHRHHGPASLQFPDDDVMHILMVLSGTAKARSETETREFPLGSTILLPADRPLISWELSDDCQLLDSFLPV